MEKIYIPGIGWTSKFYTIYAWLEYYTKELSIIHCKNPTGIELPEWKWFDCN